MITTWTLIVVFMYGSSAATTQIAGIKDSQECQRLEKVIRDWRPVAFMSTKCIEIIK